MLRLINLLSVAIGVSFVACMNISYADSWMPLGEGCGRLVGSFMNDPIVHAGYKMPFANTPLRKQVKYVDIQYVSERSVLEVTMYDQDNAIIEKREWLKHYCADGLRVHSVSSNETGGEAGAYYTADRATDIGLDTNGNLLVVENIERIQTTFGLFPRKMMSETRFTYERKK